MRSPISLRAVGKMYGKGDTAVWALRDASLDIDAGDWISVTERSGTGKSMLLCILGLLGPPLVRLPWPSIGRCCLYDRVRWMTLRTRMTVRMTVMPMCYERELMLLKRRPEGCRLVRDVTSIG